MADDKSEEVEERDEDEDEEPGAEGEDEPITGELRSIEGEAKEQQRRLKKMALRIQGDETQLVLRELAGSYEMLRELASATAEAIDELDDQIADSGPGHPIESFLTEDDAREFYAVLSTNLKLARDALAAVVTDDERAAIEKIVEMNEGMVARVCELGDVEEDELRSALSD